MVHSFSTLLFSATTDKNICESFDCSNEATVEISIDAGKFGVITLNLCDNCIVKFKE